MTDWLNGSAWRPKGKSDQFFGPFLKVERADFHIHDFQYRLNGFQSQHPYKIVAEDDGQQGIAWTLRITQKFPDNFPTIIGDAIQNLRAALDLAIFSFPKNGRNNRQTYFPTADDKDALQRRLIEHRFEKWAPYRVIKVLKTTIEPYFGGAGSLLRSLDTLSIIDKHRLIVPTFYRADLETLLVRRARETVRLKPYNRLSAKVEDGAVLANTGSIDGIEIGDEAQAALFVGFDLSKARVDEFKVTPTLIKMRHAVEGALIVLREAAGLKF